MVRRREGDPIWKAWSARLLYRIVNYLSDVKIPNNATDFRLLSRRAIDALNRLDERNRYIRGFSHWIGFRQCAIVYDRRPAIGRQKQGAIFLHVEPGRERDHVLFDQTVAVVLAVRISHARRDGCRGDEYLACFCLGMAVPGLTTIYLLLLANLGVMLVGFGTVGEYVGRIYIETKHRPLYLVERTINVNAEEQMVQAMPQRATQRG